MTTQFHSLRLDSKITEAVVNFSKEHAVDLNTVEHWTSNMIIVGEPRCGKEIHIRQHEATEEFKKGVYVTLFNSKGDVIENVNIDYATL